MRNTRVFALALFATGCASAGSRFPKQTGDPQTEIGNAERLITQAQQAGADSLAPEALTMARQQLAAAQADRSANRTDAATFKGRLAAADATYARALAERVKAERARDAAQAALQEATRGEKTP
jgi:hypothetical protein